MTRRGITKAFNSLIPIKCVTVPRIQRYVAAEAAIHIDDFTLGYFEALRNCLGLIWPQLCIVESRNRDSLPGY
jgi:hypothetical protein